MEIVTIISCSTNVSDEEDKDEFFTEITTITKVHTKT